MFTPNYLRKMIFHFDSYFFRWIETTNVSSLFFFGGGGKIWSSTTGVFSSKLNETKLTGVSITFWQLLLDHLVSR